MSKSSPHKRGDLVHVPQAVVLIDRDNDAGSDPQLTIPLRVQETSTPRIGVVVKERISEDGYVRIYCDGDMWSVKNENLYSMTGRTSE